MELLAWGSIGKKDMTSWKAIMQEWNYLKKKKKWRRRRSMPFEWHQRSSIWLRGVSLVSASLTIRRSISLFVLVYIFVIIWNNCVTCFEHRNLLLKKSFATERNSRYANILEGLLVEWSILKHSRKWQMLVFGEDSLLRESLCGIFSPIWSLQFDPCSQITFFYWMQSYQGTCK